MMRGLMQKQWLASAVHLARGPIAGSAILNMSYRSANMLLGFFAVFLLGRTLGVEGFGVFTFGLTIATLIAAIIQAGLETFLVRFVAEFFAKQDWRSLTGVLRFSLFAAAGAAILIYAGCVIALATAKSNSSLLLSGVIGAAIAPLIAVNTIGSAVLRGLGNSGRAYFPQLVLTQAVHIVLLLILFNIKELTPETALISLAAAWIAATTISWVWVLQSWPLQARKPGATFQSQEWRRICVLILLSNIAGIVFGRVEMMALAEFSTPVQIGLYSLALRFAQLTTLPGFAVGGGLDPAIAHFHAVNDKQALSRRVIMATRASTGAGVLIAVGVSLAAWVVFPLMNEGFAAAAPIVAVLAMGFVMQLAAGRPLPIMIMLGLQREAASLCLLSAFIGVVFVFLLSAYYGAWGAAAATALAFALMPAALSFALFRITGLRCDIFARIENPKA